MTLEISIGLAVSLALVCSLGMLIITIKSNKKWYN